MPTSEDLRGHATQLILIASMSPRGYKEDGTEVAHNSNFSSLSSWLASRFDFVGCPFLSRR